MRERKLNRLSGYDYSTAGSYFITICIKNRECMFGEILDGEMKLNESGKIADEQWKWLFQQYNYIRMDEYVIMPNHFHGIIHIVGNGNLSMYGTVATVPYGENGRSPQQYNNDPQQKIKPIPELIGAFKTTSSKLIHRNGNIEFHWQKSYHDRIIRNERELYRIQKYISNNPKNWNRDKENQSAYRNCKERSRPFPTTTMPTTTQNNIRIMANNE